MNQKDVEISPVIVQGRKFRKLTENRPPTWPRISINKFNKIPLEIRQKVWEESRSTIKVKPFIKESDKQ